MPITKLRPTFTLDQDRLHALAAIAPEAFADGKINWEALREALGDRVEDDGRDAEHFGLFWPGKRDARRVASQPSAGALRPAPGEGVNEATTRHLFIEGDNLEVLKLLQKSYAGRVKMIYIDPPYNTGNDFIYSDSFTQPVDEYLRATGQADEAGRVLVTNTQAGGRFHSNWLNMMYPRLRLARNLLRDDGVIFVSIDDREVHNLRMMMNEVFGEESHYATIVWQKKDTPSNDVKTISVMHEYIVAYQRSEAFGRHLQPRSESQLENYKNPDNDPRGPWIRTSLIRREARPERMYPIMNPRARARLSPPGTSWRVPPDTFAKLKAENRIWWGADSDGDLPFRKRFLSEVQQGVVPVTWWDYRFAGSNRNAKMEIRGLFEQEVPFETPKPSSLIVQLLKLATEEDDLVLDFFAGSCTTAQAVLELNREDDDNRHFIMVQLPEPIPSDSLVRRSGFATIAEIGKERIRRVIKPMQSADAGKLITGRDTPEDLGFRVFKLDRSNYKAWRDFAGGDVAELETLFDRFESPLVEGWHPEDVLVEVMLMEGFPLDSTTEPLPEFTRNTVTRVSSDLVAHRLFVCLDAAIHDETIAALDSSAPLALGEEDIFICLDSALTDEAKVRLEDGRRVKVI